MRIRNNATQIPYRYVRRIKREKTHVGTPCRFHNRLIVPSGLAETFIIADGDVAALKAAIASANANGQDDTIDLALNGTYILASVDNFFNGANGLPVIADDSGTQSLSTATVLSSSALPTSLQVSGSCRSVRRQCCDQ